MRLPPLTPDFKTEPYWWETDAPVHINDALPESADTVIVGGGYAGLSAALALSRAGLSVVVLEKDAIGAGASTRNGGMVSGGINIGKGKKLAEALGQKATRGLLEDAARSYTHLERLIDRQRIACDYESRGRFIGAHTPVAFAAQRKKIDLLNQLCGARAELVPREQQSDFINSRYYYGGMFVGRSGAIHPSRYHRGLFQAARKQGVIMSSATPATRIDRTTREFVVNFPGGGIRAGDVVIATNGYTGEATPWHRRRVIPVGSYIIATERLGKALIRDLFPTLSCITDSQRNLAYFRPSPDHQRIIFGGRAGFPGDSALVAMPRLYQRMCKIFPILGGVKISHAWTGNVAFTFDWLPHMGRDERGVHYCLGCNGSGIAMMSYLGHMTAQKILRRSPECAFDERPFPTRPFYTGDPWVVSLIGGMFEWMDRSERWFAEIRNTER